MTLNRQYLRIVEELERINDEKIHVCNSKSHS